MKRIKKILKVLLIILVSLVLLVAIASTINNRIGNCAIKGKIEGLGTRLALVSGGDYSHSNNYIKIIMVVNNSFSFKVKLNEAGGGRLISWNMLFKRQSGKPLYMRSKLIAFDLSPNDAITIKGSLKDYSVNYSITGNEVSSESSKFRSNNLHILEKETQLELIIDSLRFSNSNDALIDSLEKEFDNTRLEYGNKRLEYVLQNPNQELSAFFLGWQQQDTLIKYFPTLGKDVLLSYKGKELQERVSVYKQTEEGKLAPNIVDANSFVLSDLKGKYVVLDFWGTWCGACIKGFPKMRTYYTKYSSKVEFVGIACNDKKSTWEKYIKKEGLPWTQLLNNPEINDFTKQYNIDTYPTKIIIDKEGKIVKIFKGERNDFYEKLDELLQE